MWNKDLKARVEQKIKRSIRTVFLRSDFKKLGGYDQVGRALRLLTSEGKLIKIGYGLYAKAKPNRLTGEPMFTASGGFVEVAQAALKRLGVSWDRSEASKAYQNGSTQVPVNAAVLVFDRFSRKIGTDKFNLDVMK